MTETISVLGAIGNDTDGDPITVDDPVTLTPLEIAPGNALMRFGKGGDLTDVEFTVYFPLRVRTGADEWSEVDTLIHDGDEIEVRGRRCLAMVQVWRSRNGGARGGVAVLARSKSGKAV
jgi:hypothetical protein